MNKDYMFLKNFYSLIESGYSIEETLLLCRDILHISYIDQMINQLQAGFSIEHVLMNTDISPLFKEYFTFYKNKNCLSEAIEKSLNICLSREKHLSRLKSQLTYPCVLLIFLFLFSVFVVMMLLPNVEQLFDSFQIQKNLVIQIMFFFFYLMPWLIILLGGSFMILMIRLLRALKFKNHKIIEWYLKLPVFKVCLQKYFSLKFCIYYQELLEEEYDSVKIIHLLNEQMSQSDLKIVLYELQNRLYEGEALEDMLKDFEYLDPLFLRFFEMYMQNPIQRHSLHQYIDLTYEQIDIWIQQLLKYLIPLIYGFVAIFVITIYISIIIPMMNVISDI